MGRPLGAEHRPDADGRAREVGFAVAALGGYLVAAVWARSLSLPASVLIWFPPAGVALGVLYFRPRLAVPLVVVEAVSTVVVMGRGDDFGPVALAVNSMALVGAYALGAWVLRRTGLDPRLRTPEDLLRLALGCVVVGATAATVVGLAVQVAIDLVPTDDLPLQAAVFWVGDVVGTACLTPIILLVGTAVLDRTPLALSDGGPAGSGSLLLAELLAPSVVAVAIMVTTEEPMRFAYLAFVPVALVALRHGVVAAALTSAVTTAVMTAGANVLLADSLDRSDFQLLLFVLASGGLLIGAVVSARFDAREARRRLDEIVEATPDLVATIDAEGVLLYLNPAGQALVGIGPDAIGTANALTAFAGPLDVELTREGMRTAARTGTWSGATSLRRQDGTVLPVSQVIIAHTDSDTTTFSTVCRDMTAQHRLEQQLTRAALYDEDTQLPNRALLLERLDRLAEPTSIPGRTALLFIDVDAIGWVNERYGFATGDAAIAVVGARLQEQARGTDQVARYGGSQFVVVLPDVDDELDALRVALRILDLCAEPIDLDDRSLVLSASIGVALAERGADHRDPLRHAEIALHRAREAGGGRIALFDQDLEAQAQRHLEIESDLHQVLDTGSWWLEYQPVVDVPTGRVVSLEALLRWTHPERGPVGPFDLIRLAESSGVIVGLGREIFRRACVEACRWHELGHPVAVAVNVSARQLREPDMVRQVRSVLDETGIAPHRVVVELTETVVAGDAHGELAALADLRALGCRVAIDDFGTGYSTLSGLMTMPVDVVKLDRQFVTDLPQSRSAAALVEAVVHLAVALDVTVVAEGAETPDQVAALVELGCHLVQGFAISAPLAPEDVGSYLRAQPAPA